jgi:hypothetical protein
MNGYPKATGDFTNDPAAAHARQLKGAIRIASGG